ncbi:MAG: cupin domain-containing protein [bacterium]
MGLHVSSSQLDTGTALIDLHGGSMSTRFVYGNESNLMVATRSAGYHSKPHRHDCEQLNYLIDGELWIFVEQEGYLLKPGDFLRIPRNVVHWAWNRGKGACTLAEVHTPVLDPKSRKGSYGLFAPDETPKVNVTPPTDVVEYGYAAVERKILGSAL